MASKRHQKSRFSPRTDEQRRAIELSRDNDFLPLVGQRFGKLSVVSFERVKRGFGVEFVSHLKGVYRTLEDCRLAEVDLSICAASVPALLRRFRETGYPVVVEELIKEL